MEGTLSREWFIYVLCDPRIEDPVAAIRYVGATRNPAARLRDHLKRPPRPCARAEWIAELRPAAPVLEVVDRTRGDWQAAERLWIRLYREAGCDLFNITRGGLGGIGQPVRRDGGIQRRPNGWSPRICLDGARHSLGCYPTREEAEEIRLRAIDDREYALAVLAQAPTRMRRRASHKARRVNKHGYRGVKVNQYGSAYARIQQNGRSLCLGPFQTAEEAARAYDEKARELWGAEALLNFP